MAMNMTTLADLYEAFPPPEGDNTTIGVLEINYDSVRCEVFRSVTGGATVYQHVQRHTFPDWLQELVRFLPTWDRDVLLYRLLFDLGVVWLDHDPNVPPRLLSAWLDKIRPHMLTFLGELRRTHARLQTLFVCGNALHHEITLDAIRAWTAPQFLLDVAHLDWRLPDKHVFEEEIQQIESVRIEHYYDLLTIGRHPTTNDWIWQRVNLLKPNGLAMKSDAIIHLAPSVVAFYLFIGKYSERNTQETFSTPRAEDLVSALYVQSRNRSHLDFTISVDRDNAVRIAFREKIESYPLTDEMLAEILEQQQEQLLRSEQRTHNIFLVDRTMNQVALSGCREFITSTVEMFAQTNPQIQTEWAAIFYRHGGGLSEYSLRDFYSTDQFLGWIKRNEWDHHTLDGGRSVQPLPIGEPVNIKKAVERVDELTWNKRTQQCTVVSFTWRDSEDDLTSQVDTLRADRNRHIQFVRVQFIEQSSSDMENIAPLGRDGYIGGAEIMNDTTPTNETAAYRDLQIKLTPQNIVLNLERLPFPLSQAHDEIES